jgi:predicted AlkP superfamily pyrophosphatase or phosphodiesterase
MNAISRRPPTRRSWSVYAPAAAMLACCGLLAAATVDAANSKTERSPETVRLVLQITVDQLRGDFLDRYAKRFGEGGFRRLLNSGVVYTNAHYGHANTETIVGHATLATGTAPSMHGMVGNVWYDRELGRVVYNIEDERFESLGDLPTPGNSTSGPETVARSSGRSPAALLASTLSDELAEATAGRARIFSIALKDRAAVPMAGRSGKALWYSKRSGRFVSSTYYFEQVPKWLGQFTSTVPTLRYADKQWTLLAPKASYLFRHQDDRPYESMMGLYGRTFPHDFGNPRDPSFYARLASSPAGDELVAALATTLIDTQQLGQRKVVDYLAVGFSSTDYIGHTFGPSSLEAEDNLLRLDRTLAALLDTVDEKVGLEKVLVILSADHGVSEAPEAKRARGHDVERLWIDALQSEAIRSRVAERFRLDGLITNYTHPYLHLDRARIEKADLQLADVQRFVAAQIASVKGVQKAFAAAELEDGTDRSRLAKQVLANHHADRSGDVYVVPRPHWLPYTGTNMRPLTATHGSPWRYDTHVPIVFMGPGITAKRISREVAPRDVAPTIATYLGIGQPSSATGRVLTEVTGK